MTTYAFLLDLARCIGCQACVAACNVGNELPPDVHYIEIKEQTRGVFPDLRGSFQNHRCYHCGDAACVTVCPTGALYKQDGLTLVNPEICSGCGYCVEACPFHVPKLVDGRVSKCVACADVVKAGGTPWCVKTCPNHALRYGEREAILVEARQRVEAIKHRFPKAQLYGERESGGLGVILVLPEDPEALELPVDPRPTAMVNLWQKVVQPASIGLTGLSLAVTGVAAVIARRNHMKELEEFHRRFQARLAEEEAQLTGPGGASQGQATLPDEQSEKEV